MNHEIQERPMPTYIGNNGEPGIFGWLECPETLDPLDSLASYESQTAVRQKWCAIAHDDVLESIICHSPAFPSILVNQFESIWSNVVLRLGDIDSVSECFDFESLKNGLIVLMAEAFTISQSVLDSLTEQARSLETIKNLGMPLTPEEENLLAALQAAEE